MVITARGFFLRSKAPSSAACALLAASCCAASTALEPASWNIRVASATCVSPHIMGASPERVEFGDEIVSVAAIIGLGHFNHSAILQKPTPFDQKTGVARR